MKSLWYALEKGTQKRVFSATTYKELVEKSEGYEGLMFVKFPPQNWMGFN